MKLILRIVFFLAIVGFLAFAKWKWFTKKDPTAGPQMAQNTAKGNAPALGVTGYVVKSEKLDNKIFATGTILPSEFVDIKPEVAGKIVQLNIAEGKPVSKGQLLIKLNDVDLQAQLKKLQAQLQLAEQSEQRLRKLLDVKGVSQDEYDIITNQINNIKADIEFTQAQIEKTVIKAPFSGVIGFRNVSIGSYINATSLVANIQVLNPIKIEFTIPEKYANQVKIGENITFSTEGSSETFTGKVYAADNQIDPVARTYKIRASAGNAGGRLKPGAFVKVNFSLKEIDNALMVPTEAIIPILKGQQVFIARDGKAQSVSIDVGVRTEAKIQATNGLRPGDTIVTSGLMGMKNDTKLKFTTVE